MLSYALRYVEVFRRNGACSYSWPLDLDMFGISLIHVESCWRLLIAYCLLWYFLRILAQPFCDCVPSVSAKEIWTTGTTCGHTMPLDWETPLSAWTVCCKLLRRKSIGCFAILTLSLRILKISTLILTWIQRGKEDCCCRLPMGM